MGGGFYITFCKACYRFHNDQLFAVRDTATPFDRQEQPLFKYGRLDMCYFGQGLITFRQMKQYNAKYVVFEMLTGAVEELTSV